MMILNWFLSGRNLKLIPFAFIVQPVTAQSFTINGKIAGKDTGYVLLYYKDESNDRRTERGTLNKGHFRFKGKTAGADWAMIETDTNRVGDGKKYGFQFFVQPGNISIYFINGVADKAIVTGSKAQDEYYKFKKSIIKEQDEMRRLSKDYKSVDSLLKNNLVTPPEAERKRSEIDKFYHPLMNSKKNKELLYIKEHPNSFVSLMLLYYLVGHISFDSVDMMYTALSNHIKGSTLDSWFLEYNARVRKALASEYPFDKLKLDELTPPFKIYNMLKKDTITAEDFKGKLVLMDFWGLYCFPCLKANPLLEAIRKKHNKKDFIIVSVTNTEPPDTFQLASYVTKNKFSEWIHINISPLVSQTDNIFLKGDFSNYYGLGVPRTLLIDKNGRLIFKSYGYNSDEMDKLEALIERVLK
jgi:thiol-disulfide isomerase/thioredoxin